jgi:holo-[acyl-carrier protein] synthase
MELTGLGHVVGVGTDLVDVDRVRAALGRQEGLRQRLFTEAEWAYSARHRDPMPHLAARFAAKEAVMKALGHGMDQVAFHEIEVLRGESGRPSVRLAGRAAEVASAAGVAAWHLSLSHTTTLAQAVAVAVGTGPGGA